MALSGAPPSRDSDRPEFTASLRRSLIQTLILLTLVPLIAMGVAAYLRSSVLLRQQAVSQMQTLLSGQMEDVVLSMKTKGIRLERLANRGDLTSLIEQALHANRRSSAFNAIRAELLGYFRALHVERENPVFNQFFVVRPDGTILVSSNAEWEGLSLAD